MDILGYLLIIGGLVGAGLLLVLCFRQKPDKNATFPPPVSRPAVPPAPGPYVPPTPPASPAPVATYMPPTPPAPSAAYVPPVTPAPYVPPTPPAAPAPQAAPAAEPAPVEKEQHTIYAFAREAQVCICPCCDGENNIYREKCSICGFEFRRGGWGR